jgi:acetylornithine deacetylase
VTAAEILRELVAIPTPSSVSNLPLIEWVRHFVETCGWRSELIPYDDDAGIAKANMIARPAAAQANEAIDLAFVCHTDTVPFSSAWSDALQLRSSGGQLLHGCGACDVKGALACFLAALHDTAGETVRNGVALLLTADEEIGCKGMDRLLAGTHLHIRSAIVSEPTSLRPGVAGKGYGLARVTVHGAEAHSAFPSEGVSAITIAARFITELEHRHTREKHSDAAGAKPDHLFDPPHTTVNIGVIHGGSAKNILAGECSFLVEWRPLPSEDPRAMIAVLEQIAAQFAESRARIVIEPLRADRGFAPSVAGPLQNTLRKSQGRAPVGISFGSEAGRLSRVAEEVIVIGPGDMHTAHSDRECVPIAELDEWTETLRGLISKAGAS